MASICKPEIGLSSSKWWPWFRQIERRRTRLGQAVLRFLHSIKVVGACWPQPKKSKTDSPPPMGDCWKLVLVETGSGEFLTRDEAAAWLGARRDLLWLKALGGGGAVLKRIAYGAGWVIVCHANRSDHGETVF